MQEEGTDVSVEFRKLFFYLLKGTEVTSDVSWNKNLGKFFLDL